jgi:hypothetical protein
MLNGLSVLGEYQAVTVIDIRPINIHVSCIGLASKAIL